MTNMTDNDDRYVHDPESFSDSATENRTTKAYLDQADGPDDQEFDRKGWLLVATLVVAFIIVPATILYLPQARPAIASLGLTYRDAYLVLPLFPALLLGAVAVWVSTRNRTA